MQSYLSLTTELIIGFFALLVLSKVLGKNQITQLTAFDFISALVIGELLGNAIYDDNIGLDYVLYAVFVWGSLIYSIEMITQKFRVTRGLLEGTPSVVIAKGRIQYNELRKNKLDLNQLQHLLREKGIFTIREVEYGILETNGSVNIQRKHAYSTPTNKQLDLYGTERSLAVALIMDGEVLFSNLKQIHKTKEWLMSQLSARGIQSVRDVFYAEWLEGTPLYAQTYAPD